MRVTVVMPLVASVMVLASGANAAPRAQYGATVDPGGRLLAGNAVRAMYNAELGGTYYVFFKASVLGCPAVASVTGTGTTPTQAPAIVTTGPTSGAPQAVAVQIRDASGTLVTRGFQLLVTCF